MCQMRYTKVIFLEYTQQEGCQKESWATLSLFDHTKMIHFYQTFHKTPDKIVLKIECGTFWGCLLLIWSGILVRRNQYFLWVGAHFDEYCPAVTAGPVMLARRNLHVKICPYSSFCCSWTRNKHRTLRARTWHGGGWSRACSRWCLRRVGSCNGGWL